MEAVGVAVGIAGLAGLFSSVLEAADKVQNYKSYAADSQALDARFAADRLRLERWRRNVSSQEWDRQTYTVIEDLLQVAVDVLRAGGSSSISRRGALRSVGESLELASGQSRSGGVRKLTRSKIQWALRGKVERTEQIELFAAVVQQLHDIVPPDDGITDRSHNNPRPAHGSTRRLDSIGAPDALSDFSAIREVLEKITGRSEAVLRREISTWLIDGGLLADRYEDSLERRLVGTCTWIFEHPTYLRWSSASFGVPRLLWVKGPAGFGKTILCAQMVKHLAETRDFPVVHFFFSPNMATMDDYTIVFRSWVSQLIATQNVAYELACDKWATTSDVQATRQQVHNLLSSILRAVHNCVLVIDGLDECMAHQDGSAIVEKLFLYLKDSLTDATRVLIVSREEPEIGHAMGHFGQEGTLEIKISPKDVQGDVVSLSRHIVGRKLPNKSADVQSALSTSMASRCEGQFLWLTLQEQSLRKGMNSKQLQQTIDDTPLKLNKIYERNWEKIEHFRDWERDRTFSLLRWAAFALRPLTVAEIAEAVLIDEHSDEFQVDQLPDSIDGDYIETEILGLCGSLLEVRRVASEQPAGDLTVHLAHFTVKEFLAYQLPTSILGTNYRLNQNNGRFQETMLARCCLRYIRSRQVWVEGDDQSDSSFQHRLREYASTSWHIQLKSGVQLDEDTETQGLILGFLDESHPTWSSWRSRFGDHFCASSLDSQQQTPLFYAIALHLPGIAVTKICSNSGELIRTPALQLASQLGNIDVVEAVLSAGCDVDETIFHDQTALIVASAAGHREIALLLLEKGADVGATSVDGTTPLNAALAYGEISTAELLLLFGADVNSATRDGQIALHTSAYRGSAEVAQFLVNEGVDVTAAEKNGWTALHIASGNGHEQFAQVLMANGADVAASDQSSMTPLHHASGGNFPRAARLLLDNGAQMTADSYGWTPLHTAAWRGCLEVARTLIDHGAEMHLADDEGLSPLFRAIVNSQLEMVRLFLSKGVNIARDTVRGWSPLHQACFHGHLEIARLLLDNGANSQGVDKEGWHPLHVACYRGHESMVDLLLQHGADPSSASNSGNSPLLLAVRFGHLPIIQPLIEKGADITASDTSGWSAIHIGCSDGRLDIVKLLVSNGVDTNLVGKDRETPLLLATAQGHTEVTRYLLENGADASTGNRHRRTPVNAAAVGGHFQIVHLLAEHGGDVSTTDDQGVAPFHIVTARAPLNIFEMLLRHPSTDVNAKDFFGVTSLHVASRFGLEDKVQALLRCAHIELADADRYGSTPLAMAVRNGHCKVVELLLDAGSRLDEPPGICGSTLLGWAVFSRNEDMISLLRTRAEQLEIHLPADEPPSDYKRVEFDLDSSWCDACSLTTPVTSGYYLCNTCFGGRFCLCSACHGLGVECPEGHSLEFVILEE